MIDPIVNLAFSMHTTKKLYALLLGSGISKAVGIPTGQEVRNDLARRLKDGTGVEVPDNVGYDQLLHELGKTPSDRNSILRSYFEPSLKELEDNEKVATPTHDAIADLIIGGYISVVLTTNFDRLLEESLLKKGKRPDVIRSEDMLKGATPLRHSEITIIQLHGDYRDNRMLNTPKELSKYSKAKEKLLETILEEFGLIVCGWSARWDTALRNAILRVKSRRYSTYWIEPHDLSPEANELIKHRSGNVIKLEGEAFFRELKENVSALEGTHREHPLTVALAIERVKKWIPHESKQIELEDLITETGESAYQQFVTPIPDKKVIGDLNEKKLYQWYLEHYCSTCEIPLNIVTTLCWYGKGQAVGTVKNIAERWAELPSERYRYNHDPRRIPALLLIYTCGVAAIQRSEWQYLHAIYNSRIYTDHHEKHILNVVRKHTALDEQDIGRSYDVDRSSMVVRNFLRPFFSSMIPQDHVFHNCFDLLELIIAMLSLHQHSGWISHNLMGPYYNESSGSHPWSYIVEFWISGARLGNDWIFLKLFFDGERSILQKALSGYQTKFIEFYRYEPPDLVSIYSSNFREKD